MGTHYSKAVSNCIQKVETQKYGVVTCDNLSQADLKKMRELHYNITTIPDIYYGIDWYENGAYGGPAEDSPDYKRGMAACEWRIANRYYVSKM